MFKVGIQVLIASIASLSIGSAHAGLAPKPGAENETPKELEGIGITEHVGDQLDLNTTFRNESGEIVPLSKYFQSGKPVLMSLAYYNCPSLCGLHLNGVKEMLRELDWTLGDQFEYVVISIDPRENAQLASEKKANYLKAYGRLGGEKGWHFLTGTEESISAIAKTVGFSYRWDEAEQQYAHASAAYVLTPQGKISRYLYGITFDPQTVRLSLIEASDGKSASVIDRLILYCFHYDPKASKYTIIASQVMRAGGVLAVLVLMAFMVPFWLRQRQDQRREILQGEV